MNTNDLNEYIKHYFEKDRTHSAIMLNGGWGTGKSYYIQHELIPFLDTETEKRCIVISLYGLKDTAEISKGIFWEIKAKKVMTEVKSEKSVVSKLAAKTIARGVTSFLGVDLRADEADLVKLYESVDLSDKLIILEDIERSQIDLQELLGYVNNLVEHDDTKVLLVANEKEMLKYTESEPDEKGNVTRIPTEETIRYRKIKEKTVSDTIMYVCDYDKTIANILSDFELHPMLDITSGSIQERVVRAEIALIMMELNCYNLRSLIYACQKTSDLFLKYNGEKNVGFWKAILYSVIAFSLRMKSGETSHWPDNSQLSAAHGTSQYPLYKFAYDYIYYQKFDMNAVQTAEEVFVKNKQNYERLNDPDLLVLYSYHEQPEAIVVSAITNILVKLKNDSVDPMQFGKVANYLISLKPIVGCHDEIDECKSMLLSKIKKQAKELSELSLFSSGLSIDNNNAHKEYLAFKDEVMEIFKTTKSSTVLDFDYSPDCISAFVNAVREEQDDFCSNRAYARLFDMDKVRNMLINCSAKQLQDFRSTFLCIYHFSNISDFYADDKPAIETLLGIVRDLENYSGYDKIQKLQISYFAGNLESILKRI